MTPAGSGAIFSGETAVPFDARSPVSLRTCPARPLVLVLLGGVLAATLTACEDPLSSRRAPVPDEPSEATLISLEDGDLRDASAFDVTGPEPVRTDQTPGWDFAVARAEGGGLVFAPRNVLLGGSSAAGLQRVQSPFDELEAAPEGGYVTDETVPVDSGAVYAVRSRRDPAVTVNCFRFLKLEVLSVDRSGGLVTVRYLGNPNCGRRTLRAGAPGDEQDV